MKVVLLAGVAVLALPVVVETMNVPVIAQVSSDAAFGNARTPCVGSGSCPAGKTRATIPTALAREQRMFQHRHAHKPRRPKKARRQSGPTA